MRKSVKIVSIAAAVLILGLILLFFWRTGFFNIHSIDDARAYFSHFGKSTKLIFFLTQLMSVIFAPIPSNITAAAGGLVLGIWWSFALSFGAVALGSMIVFQVAKAAGREKMMNFLSRKMSDRYLEVFEAKRDTFLVLSLLLPFFPDDIICILAGLTPISTKRFAAIMLLTRPWGLLVACVFGGVATEIPLWLTVALLALCVVLFLVGLKYGDRVENALIARFRRRHPKKEEPAAEEEPIETEKK